MSYSFFFRHLNTKQLWLNTVLTWRQQILGQNTLLLSCVRKESNLRVSTSLRKTRKIIKWHFEHQKIMCKKRIHNTYHQEQKSHQQRMPSWLWLCQILQFWCISYQTWQIWSQKIQDRWLWSSVPYTSECDLQKFHEPLLVCEPLGW